MNIRTLAGAVAVMLTAACSGNHAPAVGPQVGPGSDWVEIRVENGTPVSLRVSALADGSETAIGRVDALSSSRLRIPTLPTGMVRLVARPSALRDGHRRHVSEPVALYPNQLITWELRPSPGVSDVPQLSTIRVRLCAPEGC